MTESSTTKNTPCFGCSLAREVEKDTPATDCQTLREYASSVCGLHICINQVDIRDIDRFVMFFWCLVFCVMFYW